MKKNPILQLCMAISLLSTFLIALAQPPAAPVPAVPGPPTGDARSYLLMDYHSGRMIASRDIDMPVEPASLVKMMTAYVAGQELRDNHISMDDMVLVSEKAWRMEGSRMFIEVGTRVSVRDLLKGVIIQSGNDASVALAEHISGSEQVFAQLMNQAAQKLGMHNTVFTNSTGMPDPDMTTTARDLAELSIALIRDFPELYGWHAIRQFEYNNISQQNRNNLLWRDDSVDGIKTGHTKAAGYCLVASAERGDMRLISVVAGSESNASRMSFSQSLLEYGFRFFETHKMFGAGEVIDTARVWKAAETELAYGVGSDLYITVPRGRYPHIEQAVSLNEPLAAPVMQNQEVGTLHINLADEELVSTPVISLVDVEQAGFVGRITDRIRLLFQ